jgi:hypothetical protein
MGARLAAHYSPASSSNYIHQHCSVVINLAAGDYVEVKGNAQATTLRLARVSS